MAFELREYPPQTFCIKYGKYMAPQGILMPPQMVFKSKKLGSNAEETFKKAFKITKKKLVKLRGACSNCQKEEQKIMVICPGCNVSKYCSDKCLAERKLTHVLVCQTLKQEEVDQMVECLASPVGVGREVLRGSGGGVRDWHDWFTHHTRLADNIKAATPVVAQWWTYMNLPYPGDEEIMKSLQRVVSNVFSTVLTIGQCARWLPRAMPKDPRKPIHIHLLGADLPEVKAVESGLIQLCSRVLGRPLVVTLVAPDLLHHPQVLQWTADAPFQVTPMVSAIANCGLYHEFWQDLVATGKTSRPHVAMAIHPGVHTGDMLALWRPTLDLLVHHRVPLVMTTYNLAEYDETLQVLEPLALNIVEKGPNPVGSMLQKQTPYEPDHVWALNSYFIVVDNAADQPSASQ